ncbi:MAG TPA: hypothetical protein PLS51_13095 [Flavobacterium sp.]|jgi:hypothetical protein|nr:hypothetical protein [Flavobacterium sp.]HPJ11564.1 hypothetical protein [Flavobacterium sp.]
MSIDTRIEEIRRQGYYVDFGDVFNQSYANFKKIALNAGLVFILLVLMLGIFMFGLGLVGVGLSSFATGITNLDFSGFSTVGLLIYFFAVVLVSGLAAPINAGIINMAYLAAHNREFSVSTAFGYYQSNYFKELFVVAVLSTFLNLVVNFALESVGYAFLGQIFNYLVAFFLMLSTPLIIFGEVKAIESIKLSILIVSKQFFILLGLAIVSVIFCCLGIFGLCIGIFFTIPFLHATTYSIYDNIIGTQGGDELDEIGTTAE